MKTLILSANTGQGHNSCAKAISEAFAEHGEVCVIEDVFGLVSKKLSRRIERGHEKSYRQTPKFSNASYRFWEKHPGIFAQHRLVYQVMSIGSRQVGRCIREGNYDTVICTHVLAAMMLTATMCKEQLKIKSAFVATDYSCTPGVNGTRMDRYFIPHENLTPTFAAVGVPISAVYPVGIPVRKAFICTQDKAKAKQAFDISSQKSHLLMMCGSMGCGPIPEMLDKIALALPEKWEITVVCGTNDQLKNSLEASYAAHPSVHIRGYVDDMPRLLASADLYLTKPGGLSTTEAAAAAIPMVLIDAVAGCEEDNLHHFVNLGAAVTGENAQDVAKICLALMNDKQQLAGMREVLHARSAAEAAERIWEEMKRLA